MSYIRNVIYKHIYEYNKAKNSKWHKPEQPPENTFTLSEVISIGKAIAEEIDGRICDKLDIF